MIFIAGVSLFLFKASIWAAEPGKLPFAVGEQIVYTISWEMIPAGKAWFKVLDFTDMNGQKAWHFVLEAKSKAYVDLFYKIRDKFESQTNEAFTHSLLYKKTQRGKADKQVVVEFDWTQKKATYSNFGGKRDPIDIPENTFDPLSSFYKLRSLPLNEWRLENKEKLFFPVTDGKKCFIQEGQILKQETLTLDSGTYDTYLIAPQVTHFSGVFEKSDNPTVMVWVSADERQVPVRIKIKVLIGSIIFDLAAIH
ncbi:MAG: DUF3108 domain-containing protein [Pseudomonadota bacterium]